jgi:uncharacterized membrane protein YczE
LSLQKPAILLLLSQLNPFHMLKVFFSVHFNIFVVVFQIVFQSKLSMILSFLPYILIAPSLDLTTVIVAIGEEKL